MAFDLTIRITGQAGQGMQSVSHMMGKIFTRQGLYVFIHQDVESRIRGGHGFTQVRVRERPVQAPGEKVDLLIALDRGAVDADLPDLADDGVMLYDPSTTGFQSDRPQCFAIPLDHLAEEHGKGKIMVNSVAAGAAFALLGVDLKPVSYTHLTLPTTPYV